MIQEISNIDLKSTLHLLMNLLMNYDEFCVLLLFPVACLSHLSPPVLPQVCPWALS